MQLRIRTTLKKDFIVEEINEVKVPVASLESMLKLKQGIRDIVYLPAW